MNKLIRTLFSFFVILVLFTFFEHTADAQTKDTPHYDVVAEYIRSLGAIHRIQRIAVKESQEHEYNPTKTMMDAIRNGTRFKLELNTGIGVLERMRLKEPFDELIPNTIYFYKQKVELFDEVINISKNLAVAVPKPGVDYSKMAVRMPEITAQIEYIDETIFQSMVLVFALLIDEKPDSEGHMSHLNITKAERQKLIDNIDGSFGESLDKDNKSWVVSSAALLKTYLMKDYKCRDEW